MGMMKYENEEILKGILNNDNSVLQAIYDQYYHKIYALVTRNSGNEDDVNDIFQEAIIVIYRKLKEKRLELNGCTFETYFYSVSRLMWLKQLERRKKDVINITDISSFSEDVYDEDLNELTIKNERYKLFQKHFVQLGEDCQKILKLFFKKIPLKQIAEMMGYSSDSYVKKRKHQCKEYLVANIKQDSEFKNINDNDW